MIIRKWDYYEVAKLLEISFKVHRCHSKIEQNKILMVLSNLLRNYALLRGMDIDEKYRNLVGIRLQFLNMEYIITKGKKGFSTPSKLFKSVYMIYRFDSKKFAEIIKDANEIMNENIFNNEEYDNKVKEIDLYLLKYEKEETIPEVSKRSKSVEINEKNSIDERNKFKGIVSSESEILKKPKKAIIKEKSTVVEIKVPKIRTKVNEEKNMCSEETEENLKNEFTDWLRRTQEFRLVKVQKYIDSLEQIDKIVLKLKILRHSLLEIKSEKIIKKCAEGLLKNPIFIKINEAKCDEYREVIIKYYEFLCDKNSLKQFDGFDNILSKRLGLKINDSIMQDYIKNQTAKNSNKDEFKEWLMLEKNLTKNSAKDYLENVNTCSLFSISTEIENKALFEIEEAEEIANCIRKLLARPLFLMRDDNGKLSEALNKYYEFISTKSETSLFDKLIDRYLSEKPEVTGVYLVDEEVDKVNEINDIELENFYEIEQGLNKLKEIEINISGGGFDENELLCTDNLCDYGLDEDSLEEAIVNKKRKEKAKLKKTLEKDDAFKVEEAKEMNNKFDKAKDLNMDFSEWLTSETFFSNKVVKEYVDALKTCSRYSVQYGIMSKSLIDVSNGESILKCKDELFSKPVFKKMNENLENLYGDVLDKYYTFITKDDSIIYSELSKAESLTYLPKEQKDIEYIELNEEEDEYKLSRREKKLEAEFSIKVDDNNGEFLVDSIEEKFIKYLSEIENENIASAKRVASDVNTCSNFANKAMIIDSSFFKVGEKNSLIKYMKKLFFYSVFIDFDEAQNNRCSIALQKYYDYICNSYK